MPDVVPSLNLPLSDIMVDVDYSPDRNIHCGFHHKTDMQRTISRNGCGHVSVMIQAH